ncbi:DNA polymerase III subunit gamma/tau [Candidatus Daviesbacteria bacterium]|nr:DNA polymerase III subunit gamma/tau [Candidatus Daviesbacteria bacterium]
MEIFYLKYRPKSLDDLVGQESVKKILLSSFEAGKLSHAYLLVGPRGTGKTSTARILAKMVNCEGKGGSGKGKVPCNECSICLSITDGSNLDLIEIDAASNRGIEDIRSLREKIKLAPTSAKKKVYIIDEVHMLTTEAFNALLKTLEEPPSHVMFILATTDVGKIPQTIISRVQRLDFKLASLEELAEALKRIIKQEKIDIDDEAIGLIANLSHGSFRDAVKLLDQVSVAKQKIDADLIAKTFHGTTLEEVFEILDSIANKNNQQALLSISKQIEQGVEVKTLLMVLMEEMREMMLIKHQVGPTLVAPKYVLSEYKKLESLAEQFTISKLNSSLEILQEAFEKIKFASIPQLPLELAVVEICGESAKGKVQSGKSVDDKLEVGSEKLESEVRNENSTVPPQDPTSHLPPPTSNSDSAEVLKLKEKWEFVLETIRPYNFSLEALLRTTKINDCSETTIILEVPYSFHQRILETPKNRDMLEGILSEVIGRAIKISTILGTPPQRREDIANIEVAADDEIIKIASEIFNSEPN